MVDVVFQEEPLKHPTTAESLVAHDSAPEAAVDAPDLEEAAVDDGDSGTSVVKLELLVVADREVVVETMMGWRSEKTTHQLRLIYGHC